MALKNLLSGHQSNAVESHSCFLVDLLVVRGICL